MDSEEQESFVKNNFWQKVKQVGSKIPFLRDVVAMYYCLLDEKTSFSAKATIVLALVYFISPVDAIPDFIALLGFTDDASVIATTLLMIKSQMTNEHFVKADEYLKTET
ncbi:MAG: YkvA family protein [Leptospira sp.]|nr:YkvA family protein [Leptospira sp.]